MSEIYQLIIAAISGGVFATFANYLLGSRSAKKDEFDILVKTWKEDNERLRGENDRLESEITALRDQVSDLRSKVILMESAHTDAPIPMWLKDMNFKMLSVNRAYEDVFLRPMGMTASDYIGKEDGEVWDSETANEFRVTDQIALDSENPFWTVETVGKFGKYKILKYVRTMGRAKIGIAGIAIPLEEKHIQ